MNCNYEVAVGCMKTISNIGREGFLEGVGVSKGDFDRLISDGAWLAVDRNRMTACFGSIVNASVDALGMNRFNLPAEWIAAGIAVFVHPVNMQVACRFLEYYSAAEDMGRGLAPMNCSSEQLFSLVVQLTSGNERNAAREQFTKYTSIILDKMKTVPDGTKKK